MKKRLLAMLTASALCVGMLAGCGGSSGSSSGGGAAAGGDKTFRVGFVNIDNADPNCYPAMQNFVKYVESEDFAKSVGADKVEALTADSAKDIEKQTTNVETLLNKGVDIMFIIGVDTEGNTASVKACNQEGVPVFMVGTEASGGDWKFIGFNESQLGQYQGEWCVDNLPENTKICLIEGTPGREAAVMRKQGFLDAIEARSDLEVISTQTSEFDTALAMQVTEDWIQTYGDEIGCIVAPDSNSIVGAVEALKAANMVNTVITCGVSHVIENDGYMIKDGTESYAVYVSWPSIGTLCGQIAEKVYKGEEVEERSHIELQHLTAENYDEILAASK